MTWLCMTQAYTEEEPTTATLRDKIWALMLEQDGTFTWSDIMLGTHPMHDPYPTMYVDEFNSVVTAGEKLGVVEEVSEGEYELTGPLMRSAL